VTPALGRSQNLSETELDKFGLPVAPGEHVNSQLHHRREQLTDEEEYEELRRRVDHLRADDSSVRRDKSPAVAFPPVTSSKTMMGGDTGRSKPTQAQHGIDFTRIVTAVFSVWY